ncbi:hypothetical protein SAMN05518854_11798 [Variovorax sp. YR266]|uniref:hypothetical protein n=1 Tax=Variovorax sp. YR266 TaxID=1884386 RepID=UPI00089D4C15|nr:hypothetical protein [Variovorax sp. YR266]SDZ71348.1 hypothetical protein SAMN05518854_11798 [Variovorax sp. YR266]
MAYTVTVIADGASIDQVNAAQLSYLEALEAEIGGPAQVLPCFRAWAKGVEHGIKALSPEEDQLSAAWLLATNAAKRRASPLLGNAKGIDFLFSIKHP